MNTIENGKVVALALTITDDVSDKVLQRFPLEEPTAYLHGYDNLVESLESALAGLEVGQSFDFVAENAYGEPSDVEPTSVPRRELPRSWNLQKGTGFTAGGTTGNTAKLWVHEVRGSRIVVSPDHPWAGRRVRFQGEVLEMRNATDPEREHGHAHGIGGHAH